MLPLPLAHLASCVWSQGTGISELCSAPARRSAMATAEAPISSQPSPVSWGCFWGVSTFARQQPLLSSPA